MFLTIILPCLLFSLVHTLSDYPILIVVSYDAFRYNFFDKDANPYMLKLRKNGTYATYMHNVFPTKTFPNHHTIATGLYPEKHGVVGNTFYEPNSNEIINFSYEMFHYDERVVPIWRLNEAAGRRRYSGSMMWPGGSFKYQGESPAYHSSFVPELNWHARIDTAMSWIEDPDKPANLVMIYFEEPDTHGHVFGPESKEVFSFLQQLDNITLYLEQQIELKGLTDKVNVIHLSDHGMTTVSPPGFIDITQFLPSDSYKIAGSTPCLHIIPNEGLQDELYDLLKNASDTVGHFKVYTKQTMPAKWKFTNNPRIPPIFVVADRGYGFQDLAEKAEEYAKQYNFKVTNESQFGVHGYDNDMPEMRPFFMARGPQIKVDYEIDPFNTVDLFSLFCEILKIKPTANDGSFANVQDILIGYHGSVLPIIVIIAGGVLLVLLLILCAAVVTLVIIKRQQSITTTAALNKRFPQNFSHSNIEAQHLLEPEDA